MAVTGASRGIGRATAISYAKAGASGIVVLARSDLSSLETELLDAAKKAGRKSELKVLALSGVDTTDRVAVDKAAERVAATFGGKVDILINNAGYLEEPKPIDKSDPDEWWKTWEVNVKGVYLTSRAFIPLLLKSELKTIVMVSSVGAHLTRGGMSAYQISKSAVLRLDSFLMEEYGTQGLLVYGIHPGVSGNNCSVLSSIDFCTLKIVGLEFLTIFCFLIGRLDRTRVQDGQECTRQSDRHTRAGRR